MYNTCNNGVIKGEARICKLFITGACTCTFSECNPFRLTKSGSFSLGAIILMKVLSMQPRIWGILHNKN